MNSVQPKYKRGQYWMLINGVLAMKQIIYVFRNPKDAVVSYFHHWSGMVGYKGTKEEFVQSYIDGHVNFNPFWPHVLDFWQMRTSSQIFFTSYEQMKADLSAVIKGICQFLNKTISNNEIMKLVDHLSFANMKNNPACNHIKEFESMRTASGRKVNDFRFIRRGIVGSHKDELTPKLINDFDKWNFQNLRDYKLSIDDFTHYSKY